MEINIYLFNHFETLDIFGPIEVLGRIEEYNILYYSEFGGMVKSAQAGEIMTRPIADAAKNSIFVIPGGMGTRSLIQNQRSLEIVKQQAESSLFCLSICTGSAVLAKCGVLDGKKATSNKRAMKWVKNNGEKVLWVDKARWCVDGKFYTASGVSAGIDMTLGFLSDRLGEQKAEEIANSMEYIWNKDPDNDPFAQSNIKITNN